MLWLVAALVAQAPAEWVKLPAGEVVMGRDHGPHADEKPAHRVQVSAFQMQATLCTVKDFRAFVDATGFVTDAERDGFGMAAWEGLGEWQWKALAGASWRAPFGRQQVPGFSVTDDQPVTMVSWNDATAYCHAQQAELPSEAQWEYAMRGGQAGTRFPWGDSPLRQDGRPGLNFWQGATHLKADATDGSVYQSPVKAYAPNAWGLYDPAGNVWQYTRDWYAVDTYRLRAVPGGVVVDPPGPTSGKFILTRGGSWWCSARTCSAFGLFARGKSLPNARFNNAGFRCVRPVATSPASSLR